MHGYGYNIEVAFTTNYVSNLSAYTTYSWSYKSIDPRFTVGNKYVGVQMQVFDYVGERENAMLELEKYRMVMRDFSDKAIGRGKSALTLMQEHSPYDENNIEFWHKLSVEIRPFLQIEQNPLEELYLVSAEDIHEEEN